MKKTRIISTLMALSIVATPSMVFNVNNASKSSSYQITAYAAKNGWKKEGNNWYYYVKGNKLKNQWKKIGNNWYYFGQNGAMYTDWGLINGKWYYFDQNGDMNTGLKQINGESYYFDLKDGYMYTDWRKIGSKWFYFGSDGAMYKNRWLSYNYKWYYFDASGYMTTGWQKISNKWYYFNSSGAWVDFSGAYRVTKAIAYPIRMYDGGSELSDDTCPAAFNPNSGYVATIPVNVGTVLVLDSSGKCTSGIDSKNGTNFKGKYFHSYVNVNLTKIN